jgi:acyl-CoA synthetase (AMP-forming)/AMP-acid ligase II
MNIPLTPIRFLYRAVDLYGKKEGIISGNRRFTYAEFGERCERLAAGLLRHGVQRGDRVAFLSFNNHQLLEGYYGPPLIRAVAMPLNVRLTPAELSAILNHAQPRILIFESEFAPVIEAFRKTCPSVERYVSIDGDNSLAEITYEALLEDDRIERPDLFSFDENEMAELFYTSGSTGSPKGVMLSHRTVYVHALEAAAAFNQSDLAVQLHTIPLFHANGWGLPQIATMYGARHVMIRRFEPAQVLRTIESEGATGMLLVPVMANALLNCPELGRFDTRSLQEIMLGGSAASPELVARLEQTFRCKVICGYGLTETCPVASCSRPKSTISSSGDDDRLFRASMAGWAILGTEIRVVGPDGKDLPRDMKSIGEVIIRGDNVMEGYYREPEATRQAIVDGWLHTGDMAVWDEENYIHIVDRKKDIIISGGENISSIEIEKAIAAHPTVFECAVFAAPDDKWGEVPVAIVALKNGASLNSDQLIGFLQARLANFKLPRLIKFVGEPLPKTGTGKILKRELREEFWAGKQRRVQGA